MTKSNNFNGEYVLVFSATNKKLDKHIRKVLEKERFKEEKKGQSTRVIWVIEKFVKEEEEGKESQGKVHEKFETEWPRELKKNGHFHRECFIKKPSIPIVGKSAPKAAKFKIDIFKPENLEPLRRLGEQLASAILFSDGMRTDCKLPLLIRQLKEMFPHISIAAEYTQPGHECYPWEAGADEVFNRDLLWHHTMALTILNTKTEAQFTDFISRLVQKEKEKKEKEEKEEKEKEENGKKEEKEKIILGMNLAYLRSIRLNLEEGNNFFLDESNWSEFKDIAEKIKVRPLAVFCRKNGEFGLESLRPNRKITLKNGDCFLLLTHSSDKLNQFEKEVLYEKKSIFVK